MQVFGSFDGAKSSIVIILGIAKLTGRFLTVWLWKILQQKDTSANSFDIVPLQ
jgi:hypothetical protein